jgi:HD-GYP domain-containing protein (c-di-GMP phosphodiesterase class II)
MIRFSNIFKRNGQNPANLPKGIKPEERPQEDILAEETAAPEGHHKSSIKISTALDGELKKERSSTPNITHLYEELLLKAKSIYSFDHNVKRDFTKELNPLIERMLESLISGSDELLLMALRDYADPEGMIFYHVVNISIMALAMGLGLGYERSNLLELGVAAFIHDIGAKNFDMLSKKDVFSDDDLERIKIHPHEGALTLGKIDVNLPQKVLDAVKQEHERADGSGYPDGLVSDEINEYAQIIGLADVYEALMHDRPYRDKYTSIDTIRIILKNKKLFTGKVIKSLIEAFGIFPVETLVQLNTKEIGIVVKRNQELISRPVVDIIIDSYGKESKKPKRINLADNPVIYIDSCVKQEAVSAKAPL